MTARACTQHKIYAEIAPPTDAPAKNEPYAAEGYGFVSPELHSYLMRKIPTFGEVVPVADPS